MVNPVAGPNSVGDNIPKLGSSPADDYNNGVTDLQNGQYANAYTNLAAAAY